MTQTAVPRTFPVPSIPRGGTSIGGFYFAHYFAAMFPFLAGLVLYGWRAGAALVFVTGSAVAGAFVWRRIGPRGRLVHYAEAAWLGVLLALMLPAHLVGGRAAVGELWPILPLGGLLVAALLWLFAGLGGGQTHAVLATYLLLVICFGESLVAHRVLNRDHLLAGELMRSGPTDAHAARNESWINRRHSPNDADYEESATEKLTRYTTGKEVPARKWLTVEGLLRDSMPPLEDLIIAGHPDAIGTSSVAAVLIGGLFLLYRGVIDYRIPLLTCAAAYLSLLLLPIPAVIANGPQWRWAAFRPAGNGWSVALTFVNYEMMASPLIFMAFFLATSASLRPMTRRARTVYALCLGVLCAVFQLYISAQYGPYFALFVLALLTPRIDEWFPVRRLI